MTAFSAPRVDRLCRRLLGATAIAAAAALLGLFAPDKVQAAASGRSATRPPSFAPLKMVPAGVLDVSYAEAGPADGQPVLLLHGWPTISTPSRRLRVAGESFEHSSRHNGITERRALRPAGRYLHCRPSISETASRAISFFAETAPD